MHLVDDGELGGDGGGGIPFGGGDVFSAEAAEDGTLEVDADFAEGAEVRVELGEGDGAAPGNDGRERTARDAASKYYFPRGYFNLLIP